MQNENKNTKNDLLKEIVDLSNSNLTDFMLDTKFGDLTKELQKLNKTNTMKQVKKKSNLDFNFDEVLSDNKKEGPKNEKTKTHNLSIHLEDNVINKNEKSEEKGEEKDGIQKIIDVAFDKADDILNNFNQKLKMKETTNVNNKNNTNIIMEENNEKHLDSIKEESENVEDNKNVGDINNNDDNIIIIENKIEKNETQYTESTPVDKLDLNISKKVNLEICQFNQEENKKSLGSIFDMLDFDKTTAAKNNNKFILSKELQTHNQLINDCKNEVNIIEENKEEIKDDNDNNSSNLSYKEKEKEVKDKEKQDIINIQEYKEIIIEKKEEEKKINTEENKDIKNNETKKDNNENIILNEDKNLKENKDNNGYDENNKNIINDKNDEDKTKDDKNKHNENIIKDNIIVDNMEEIGQLNKKEINMEKEKINFINENINNIIINKENENKNKNENNIIIIKDNKENNDNNNTKGNDNKDNQDTLINNNNVKKEEPKIEYTGNKIDLVEKTEHLFFAKNRNLSELNKYLNNYLYKSNNDKNSNNNDNIGQIKEKKNNKISYDITESFQKNILCTEFSRHKMTSIYLDTEDYIYCGDEIGNLLIYCVKDEKKIKQLENPFKQYTKNNNYPCITSISSDEQYIIVGYTKGKFAIFSKNEKKPGNTKLYDAFEEISQHNIIEIKIHSKISNSIIIYSCDDQENIFRTEIIKNKIFRNKVSTIRITGPLKNVQCKEPYYHLEINPFWYECVGVVNNRKVDIYVIKNCQKDIIFTYKNIKDENSYLSFFFSHKKEDKNKFFISNLNIINIFEINNNYNGVAQQQSIILKDYIIQIGSFMNDLIYIIDNKNTIKLINYKDYEKNDNSQYGYVDTFLINGNNYSDVFKQKEQETFKFLLNYKQFLSVKNGSIFIYNKNNILYIKSLTLEEGVTKIYSSIFDNKIFEKWTLLFKIGIEIYKNTHELWKIKDINKFYSLYIINAQTLLSSLVIQLGNNESNDAEFENIINKYNELVSFLFNIDLYKFIIYDKNNLHSILKNNQLEDLYFFLLEPYIIADKLINIPNLPSSFISNLMDIYLNKNNIKSKYKKYNRSWLSELLIHFDFKKYIEKGKNNVLLDNIKENNLINVIIYYLLNYKFNEVMENNLIDYCTPLNILIKLLKSNSTNESSQGKEDVNIIEIDLNNDELFKSENRYKDEIIFSREYLRIKIIWYIYKILKNKILVDNKDKLEDQKKSLFIKEVLQIPFDKELFNIIVFGTPDKSCPLNREMIYILQIIIESEICYKLFDINKYEIFQKLIKLFKKRRDLQLPLNILLVRAISNDNSIDLSSKNKLNIVLYFMENNCLHSDIYPEIKETRFQEKLIEILKLIDSYTFEDSENLLKLVDNCKDNYRILVDYIKKLF